MATWQDEGKVLYRFADSPKTMDALEAELSAIHPGIAFGRTTRTVNNDGTAQIQDDGTPRREPAYVFVIASPLTNAEQATIRAIVESA